ncbi:hypothetical protein PIB30_045698, partial [Stylosanthes scabra]|nr:hypothetical protein [Stylosanthes scabra]
MLKGEKACKTYDLGLLIICASLIEKQVVSSESVVDPNCGHLLRAIWRVELGEGGLVAPSPIEKEMPFANIVQNIATQQHNYMLEDIQHDDAGIVENEKAMTPLFQNITTQEHMPHEKQLEESVTGPELILKDLALEGTAEHDTTFEITIEKPLIAEEISKSDPKEDVAVVDSQTLRPSFDLGLDLGSIFESQSQLTLSQGQPQMAEIHGTRVEGAKIENQPAVSQGQPQMAESHGTRVEEAKIDIQPTVTQDQPQVAEIQGLRVQEQKVDIQPAVSHDIQATPTEKSDSQEEPILRQQTMDAIDEIYEKKLQIQQAEQKLQQMLEDLRAMEPIDDLENLETSVKEETKEPKTPRKRLYKWATEGEEDIMYEFLFKFMTGKTFEAVREHFMLLAKEAEMDL